MNANYQCLVFMLYNLARLILFANNVTNDVCKMKIIQKIIRTYTVQLKAQLNF